MAFKVNTLSALACAACAFVNPSCEAFTTPAVASLTRSALIPSPSAIFMGVGVPGPLDPKETALVLIEYQNEFTTDGGKLHGAVKECMEKTNMLENSANLMNAMREAGCAIIHVPIKFEKGHSEISGAYGILNAIKEGETFTKDTWNSDFHQSMRPATGDLVVQGKLGLCGFHSTNLDFILRQKGAKNVVLGGFLTNCCIESTMRTAYEHGYNVYTLKDCTAATSVAAFESSFEHSFGMFSTISTSDEVKEALKASA